MVSIKKLHELGFKYADEEENILYLRFPSRKGLPKMYLFVDYNKYEIVLIQDMCSIQLKLSTDIPLLLKAFNVPIRSTNRQSNFRSSRNDKDGNSS